MYFYRKVFNNFIQKPKANSQKPKNNPMKTQIRITTLFLCITMLYSSIIFAQYSPDSAYIEPLKISPYIQELKIDFESQLAQCVGYVLIKNTSDSIVYFTANGGQGC